MNININYEDPSFQHDEYEKVIDRVCEEAALVYGLVQCGNQHPLVPQ